WRGSLNDSDPRRLSVSLVDVLEGHESEFQALATAFEALMVAKHFGRTEMVPDEAVPRRFYAVRYWATADSAAQCHGDAEVQAIAAKIDQIARVTHLVNGVRKLDPLRLLVGDRRARVEPDRRIGFDRRLRDVG